MADKYISVKAAETAAHKAFCKHDNALQYAEMIHQLLKIPAADVVDGALFRDCRNELCLRCGQYRLRYKGACDGCRWMEVQDGG